MKIKAFKLFVVLLCVIIVAIIISCYRSEKVSVRRDIVNVGRVDVGDTVCATFKFKNHTYVTQRLSFRTDCNYVILNSSTMNLEPHKRGKFDVKVLVESPGEFAKYVYVQAAGGDISFAVTVKGYAKHH